jgi:hypothetical protein
MTSGGALLVALLSQSPIGSAGTPPPAARVRVRLDVHAAASCTSRGDLMSRITARSPRIDVVDEAPFSAGVVVTSPRPGSVVAELVLGTVGTEPSPRRVAARSCAEAADAVAFIIAVTLDPSLQRRSGTGATEERAGAEGGAPWAPDTSVRTAPPAEVSTAARPGERPAPASPPAPPAALAAAPPSERAPPVASRRELGAYVAGQTIFGPAPAVMPGVALYGMLAFDHEGPWSPALFVGAMHVWRSDLAELGGVASFTLDAANVDACPLRLRWSLLAARPCASALVGLLTARGSDTDQAVSSMRPFAAASAVIIAGLGAPVEVSARLGVGLTLIRDSYEFATNIFHRVGAVTISASLGVGAHWH